MEQLAANVGPYGKAAFPQKGEDLTVDRDPRPAQQKGGHGHLAVEGTVSRQAPHTGGQLQKPGQEPLCPEPGEAQRGEEPL